MPVMVNSESQEIHPINQTQSTDTSLIKQELIKLLENFPYETINLEQDTQFSSLIGQIEDLDLDPLQTLISKTELLAKLQPVATSVPFLNPAQKVLSYFDLVAGVQEKKKIEQFGILQQINQDLGLLSNILGEFQSASSTDKIDFSKNDQVKQLIDNASKKFGFPKAKDPYIWEDKNQVIAFLNQKTKELMHRSSEAMLHFQHQTETMKTMRDATMNMIDSDSDLKRTINQNSRGG